MTPAELGQLLRSVGLHTLLATAMTGGSGTSALIAIRAQVPPKLAVLLDLLTLQREVPVDAVVPHLGASGLALLEQRALVQRTGELVRLDGVRMINHFGALVFVGAPGAFRNGYYGNDSIGLGRILLGAKGRALDLFASTGAQAMLLASAGSDVTTVEIDASLQELLAFNAELNQCAERIQALWGDARQVPLTGPYDLVCANAPLVPSFGETGLAPGADGGSDGHTLLAQALRRVPLSPDGRLYFTATVLGGPAGPELGWLCDLAREHSLTVSVVATASRQLSGKVGDSLIATLADSSGQDIAMLGPKLREQWAREGITSIHFCLSVATRTAGAAEVTVTHGIDKGRGWWI